MKNRQCLASTGRGVGCGLAWPHPEQRFVGTQAVGSRQWIGSVNWSAILENISATSRVGPNTWTKSVAIERIGIIIFAVRPVNSW